jgi:hypothetical protein
MVISQSESNQSNGRKPLAQTKEGAIMRIQDSTLIVSTDPQPSPFVKQNAGSARLGSGVAELSFGDYLNAQIQASSEQTVSRQAEYQIAGILLGCFPQLVSSKSETKETSDYQTSAD